VEPETPEPLDEFEEDFQKLQVGKYSPPVASFRLYGIFTFWILPLIYGGISIAFIVTPGLNLLWFFLVGIGLYYPLRKGREFPKLSNIIYKVALITFGIKIDEKDARQIRTWWFILFTPILSFWLVLGIGLLSVTVVPILLILWKNKYFRKIFFSIAFLPRGELLTFVSLEEQKAKKEYQETVLHQNSEYFQFYKPTRRSRLFTYVAIFFITYFLAIFIFPIISIAESISNPSSAEDGVIAANTVAGVFLGVGLLSMIPYFVLAGPFKKYRLTRLAASKFSRTILKGISGTFLNLLPMFKGD